MMMEKTLKDYLKRIYSINCVSRTSKTPLSQYLAHKSYKVMNVPIVPEVTPPDMLFDIDSSKCIA